MQQKIWISGYWHLWCVLSPCACGAAAAELDYGTMVAIRSDSLYMFMEEPDVYPRTSDSPAWWNGILFLTFFVCIDDIDILKGKVFQGPLFSSGSSWFSPIRHYHNKSKDELQKRGTTKPLLCTARRSMRPQKRCKCPHGVTTGGCKQVRQVVSLWITGLDQQKVQNFRKEFTPLN